MLITQPLILHVICMNYAKRMDIGSDFMEVSECWRSEKQDIKLLDCIPSFLPAHLGMSAQFHYLGAVEEFENWKNPSVLGQIGNPWQSVQLDLRKDHQFCLALGCQPLFLHIFSCKVQWKVLTWQFWRLFPLSTELCQCQVKVKEGFLLPCASGSRFPALLSLLLSQQRQSQHRALAQAELNWICQYQLQKPPKTRANQDCSFPGQLPARKPAQGSFFPQDFEEASL